jgi:hypothetical protein
MQSQIPHIVRFLVVLLCAASSAWAAQNMEFYDPGAEGKPLSAPVETVGIDLNPAQPLLTIPERFYGLNVHPGSAKYELANMELLRKLKPDSIRIMTRKRVDWPPGGPGKVVHDLSPRPGVFDWKELDLLVQGIVSIGAEPYLALGFGPPHWLTAKGDPDSREPPRQDAIGAYADYMAAIVRHYVKDKKTPIRIVSIDNEPENVRYPINDYIKLTNLARQKIKAVAPDIQVGGPTTGYAPWKQPDGSRISFSDSLRKMRAAGTPFDFIDWHIYAKDPDAVLTTVSAVKKLYGTDKPLMISEFNRDWRYVEADREQSRRNNTGWDSVAWLAYLYDQMQRQGVERTYYFAWREPAMGLVDGRITQVRPNYFVFWAMTNHLGRKRVSAVSTDPGVGCIATHDGGRFSALIYNRTPAAVNLGVRGLPAGQLSAIELNKEWFESTGAKLPLTLPAPRPLQAAQLGDIKLPAGGILILKSQTSQP